MGLFAVFSTPNKMAWWMPTDSNSHFCLAPPGFAWLEQQRHCAFHLYKSKCQVRPLPGGVLQAKLQLDTPEIVEKASDLAWNQLWIPFDPDFFGLNSPFSLFLVDKAIPTGWHQAAQSWMGAAGLAEGLRSGERDARRGQCDTEWIFCEVITIALFDDDDDDDDDYDS